ncbi:UNVERIFIED_ORG: autotransporter-associated beta strand protein [Shinella zoogloeoides]|nr:autotransporter-associated beta strand protein [Shinella zoogloeoides]
MTKFVSRVGVSGLSFLASLLASTSAYAQQVVTNGDIELFFDVNASPPGTITLDNGTLAIQENLSITGPDIIIGAGGGTIDTFSPYGWSTAPSDATLGTVLSGNGTFTKAGEGTLTLTGMNTFTGRTEVTGGTLALSGQGRLNQSSSVWVGSGATLDVSAAAAAQLLQLNGEGFVVLGNNSLNVGSGTFYGIISGNGGVNVDSGTLKLVGDNTFTGQASTSANGVLQIGDGGATGVVTGNILNYGSVIFDRSATGGPITYAGVITGPGSLGFAGGATYILNSSSSSSGEVTIDSGTTLQWGTGGAAGWIGPSTLSISAGPITNNGALIINRSSDRIYQGKINGTGSFTKQASGMVALTNTNGYSGQTNVEAGTLLVDGSIAASSETKVLSGATLTGSGTVSKTTVLNGGIFAPGNHAASVSGAHRKVAAIGTMSVAGDLNLAAGSNFDVKVDDQGHSDKASVSGAVTIDTAAKVRVAALNGTDDGSTYAPETTYTILTSTGGITGQFDSSVVENFAFLDASLLQGASDIKLKLSRNDVKITDVAVTGNQKGAASALSGFDTSDPVYQRMMGMSAEEARAVYDSVSGEVHASGQQSVDYTFNLFTSSLVGGMSGGGSAGRQTVALGYAEEPQGRTHPGLAAVTPALRTTGVFDTAWITPLAGFGTIKNNGNAAKLDWAAGGLALGFDRSIESEGSVTDFGIGFGYLVSRGDVDARSSEYDTKGGFVGAHADWTDGTIDVSGRLAYGLTDVSTSRVIRVGSITRTATADYWTHTFGGGVEVGYGFALTNETKLKPVGTFDFEWSGHNGATETGAGSLNASVASERRWQADAGIGLEVEHATKLASGANVIWKARALYERALADTTPTQSLALQGNTGTQFVVDGASTARDRLVLGAGFDFKPAENKRISLNYAGKLSKSQSTHVFGASLGLDF